MEGKFPLAEVDVLVKFSDEVSTATSPPLSLPDADVSFPPLPFSIYAKYVSFPPPPSSVPAEDLSFPPPPIPCLMKMYHLYHLDNNNLKRMNQFSVNLSVMMIPSYIRTSATTPISTLIFLTPTENGVSFESAQKAAYIPATLQDKILIFKAAAK